MEIVQAHLNFVSSLDDEGGWCCRWEEGGRALLPPPRPQSGEDEAWVEK